ncbi:MAG: hypothetical protein ACMUIE_02830 [Thermoplasmatota archaeon]
MASVPWIVYVLLLMTAIVSAVMTRIARDGWRSRGWTWFFALLGSGSVLALMIIVFLSG